MQTGFFFIVYTISVNIYQNYRRILDVKFSTSVFLQWTQAPDSEGDNQV
jgi:hypothetical protein